MRRFFELQLHHQQHNGIKNEAIYPKNVAVTIDDVPMNFGCQHGDLIEVGCQQIKKQWWSIDDRKNKLTPVKVVTWISMETQDRDIISAYFYDDSDTLKILFDLGPSALSPFSYR